MKINKIALADGIVRLASFVAFAAVAVYSYGQADAWFYNAGLSWYRGLTVYHPDRFGLIHVPTTLLCIHIALSWHFSAMARDLLSQAAGWFLRRWQYKEEMVIYGDSEGS